MDAGICWCLVLGGWPCVQAVVPALVQGPLQTPHHPTRSPLLAAAQPRRFDRYVAEHADHAFRVIMEDMFGAEVRPGMTMIMTQGLLWFHYKNRGHLQGCQQPACKCAAGSGSGSSSSGKPELCCSWPSAEPACVAHT